MLKVIFLLNFPIFFFLAGFLFENIISFKFALFRLIFNIFAQSMQIKHVSCERSELCQPSAVFANQLKQASQAQSTLAKRANQASYARLHSRLRLPSPTGREEEEEDEEEDEDEPKSCFKFAESQICIS